MQTFLLWWMPGQCKQLRNSGLEACQAKCTCWLPKKIGFCKGFFQRYYFDKEAGECKTFIYGGCKGNANNFETLEICQATCDICQLPRTVGPCKSTHPPASILTRLLENARNSSLADARATQTTLKLWRHIKHDAESRYQQLTIWLL